MSLKKNLSSVLHSAAPPSGEFIVWPSGEVVDEAMTVISGVTADDPGSVSTHRDRVEIACHSVLVRLIDSGMVSPEALVEGGIIG